MEEQKLIQETNAKLLEEKDQELELKNNEVQLLEKQNQSLKKKKLEKFLKKRSIVYCE